jgi:hypothetical protein
MTNKRFMMGSWLVVDDGFDTSFTVAQACIAPISPALRP